MPKTTLGKCASRYKYTPPQCIKVSALILGHMEARNVKADDIAALFGVCGATAKKRIEYPDKLPFDKLLLLQKYLEIPPDTWNACVCLKAD